jgi:hypothetical protein
MHIRPTEGIVAWAVAIQGCVPSGSAGPSDAGPSGSQALTRTPQIVKPAVPAADLLKVPFEDDFEHGAVPASSGGPDSGWDGAASDGAISRWLEPSADWVATATGIWRIESGHLCGERAHNHGIWLKRTLPINARIEFDAVSQSPDGDLKAEFWGDGRSFATGLSYTNATSYLTILGGWHNKFHVLARINEHASDRKEITVDPHSDDPREKPVVPGQTYHFKVERSDGRTIHWWVDGNEMLTLSDSSPLAGSGHDHFGFNDWEVKVCFDNVRVVPLP